jgi:hypothetical protein
MQVDLGNGRKLYIGGTSGDGSGLAQVGTAGKVATATVDAFKAGMASLGDVFAMLNASVEKLPKRPDSIEMEFRAKLTGNCDLWIVSGEGEAEFSVKVSWGKT